MDPNSSPNRLINSTSPYLLQHAYNPVDWYPWGEEALEKAIAEDKLILVSIGYSACHWCHVMEHESFENYEVAEIMNRSFVCIKVDREERPDIDQVYMAAVQLMTGRGGWPLNCFTLPDGRPIYGGTYFPKEQWKNILLNLADIYGKDKPRFEEYAKQLTEGINRFEEIIPQEVIPEFNIEFVNKSVNDWSEYFDNNEGGPNRAPKFPLPNNYNFLLDYYFISKDQNVKAHILLTLKKMAYGGIYDQAGGGFSRYSVDGIWKVPHFEKMLYDNAQLVSLYSNAYKLFKDPLYKEIVSATAEFIERELTGSEGNFYSALDADSEGVEGKFYTWTREELINYAGENFNILQDYFNINDKGFWEHESYILLRHDEDEVIAERHKISVPELKLIVKNFKDLLMIAREGRVRPGLDDKTLASWNALMIVAYCDAYLAFKEEKFLAKAIANAHFILSKMQNDDGGLYHNYKNGKSNLNGFLEDYSFFIQALISLYQCTFDIKWLDRAQELLSYTVNNFGDEATGLFYFTSVKDTPLIARKMELQDNVIPASNSQMAINLYFLGHYFENREWVQRSSKMLSHMEKYMAGYGASYSNWLKLWLMLSQPLREIVICGEQAQQKLVDVSENYLPAGTIIAGGAEGENLKSTAGRFVDGKTLIYVCIDHTCNLPVTSVSDALKTLI